jgi:predicted Zn-dependent protease
MVNDIGLAKAAIGLGHTALGVTHLRRALESNPDDVAAWMLYAGVLSNIGRVQDGLTALAYAKTLSSTLDTASADHALRRRADMIREYAVEIRKCCPPMRPALPAICRRGLNSL